MMRRSAYFVALLGLLLATGAALWAQNAQLTPDQEANIKEYVDLLRTDVKTQKVSIITDMMQFSPQEASIFWPIYTQYDTDLTKLADERLQLIKDYAANYGKLTDAKADELITKSADILGRRLELQKKYYQIFREKLGALKAAKFTQVEHQLLLIIDLQIASSLPVLE
ncbi:MAG TPA: hypothetical protein VMW38_22195 [Terriglobia bacterium]|nr:hypothetical protein [Terriglobia bacterium]